MKLPPLTYDDFEVGMKIRSQGITVTKAHILQFAEITGDYNPLHVDDEFAKKTIFHGRIAHGLLTLSLSMGLLGPLIAGTTIAMVDVNASFYRPVKVDDTVHVEAEVIEKKPSEKYNGGIVTLRQEVKNQVGETVAVVTTKLLMARGPATEDNVLRA